METNVYVWDVALLLAHMPEMNEFKVLIVNAFKMLRQS